MTPTPGPSRQRIDKWLFFTRIAKSRTIAQAWVESGHVAVNGEKTRRPSADIRIGDRIEVVTSDKHMIVVVKAQGDRRGPFEEARLLYDDFSPPREKTSRFEQATREAGAGRPEKKERRELDRLRNRFPDQQ